MARAVIIPAPSRAAARARPSPRTARLRLTGETMGTAWSLAAFAPAGEGVGEAELRAAVAATCDAVSAQMSHWDQRSEVSRFNAAPPGAGVAVSEPVFGVVAAAVEIAQASGGAFDPCAGAAAAAMGRGPEHLLAYASGAADAWRALKPDPATRTITRPPSGALDLSAIAKGYAVDAVADMVRRLGVESFLVEIGGEFVGRGIKPDGAPWWVALAGADGAVADDRALVALAGWALASSGETMGETPSVAAARPRRHIARTRADDALASVSVVHPECMLADAWATALYAAGVSDGLAMADAQGLAALFQFNDRRAPEASRALAEMLEDAA